ncbi:MAG: Type II secretion system protein G precursor [Microgenomates group bacterium ADurb.Bin219]|nr:MAG: Type II secretion system protein G precursor [Microgenomates group bacterium ADurb.Bin219]HNP89485.1 type II secretion system protein GspG [Candidatus Woesebacteria bacterium]
MKINLPRKEKIQQKKNKSGFSLVELLIVFSLMGVLLSISLAALGSTRKSARDSKRKADLEQIRSALEMYRTDVGIYPSNLLFGTGSLSFGNDIYLSSVPNDPLSSPYTYVYSRLTNNSYVLCAYLETGSGNAGCGDCSSGVACNYRVTNP